MKPHIACEIEFLLCLVIQEELDHVLDWLVQFIL